MKSMWGKQFCPVLCNHLDETKYIFYFIFIRQNKLLKNTEAILGIFPPISRVIDMLIDLTLIIT